MGNTKSYPNAQEEVETTIFLVDYAFWTITAVGKTILLTLWLLYAYCNLNLIPTSFQTQKKKQPEAVPRPQPRTIEIVDANRNQSRSASSIGAVSTGTDNTVVSDVTVGTLQSSESHNNVAAHHHQVESAMITASSDKSFGIMDNKARLYITLSIVTALIYSYFYFTLHTLRYVGIVGEFSCALPAISLGLGWALNRLFLYLYLMHRLKACFENTFLEIKQSDYNILMRMYIVLTGIGVMFYILWATYSGCDGTGIFIAFCPLNVFDSFCALICLYIFIKKLKSLINMDQIAYDRDPKGMTDLKYLVNKFLIVSLFAILFTYFVSLLFFVYPVKCLAGIDTMVNVFCLMITTANYDFYYRISCVLCRRCCEKSFTFVNQMQKARPAVIIH